MVELNPPWDRYSAGNSTNKTSNLKGMSGAIGDA